MPRLQTLTTLLGKLKAEIGDSMSIGTARDAELTQVLSDTQQWLASERDWPFLKERWNVAAGTGARYYAFPAVTDKGLAATINTERPFVVQVKWNSIWTDVDYGIDAEEFNYIDSDVGVSQDPIERWQYKDESQFEVWPVPASPTTIRFSGQRQLDVLAQAADTCDLDDLLIVMFAGAKLLAGKPAGMNLLAAGNQRLNRLLGAYPTRTKKYVLGGRSMEGEKQQRNTPINIIHG